MVTIDTKKAFDRSQQYFMIKIPKNSFGRNTLYNKGSIRKPHSQCHTRRLMTKILFVKSRNKTRMSTFIAFIQEEEINNIRIAS